MANLFSEKDGEILIRETKRWIGTPHRNGHKERGVGVDCARLVEASLEGAGYLKENCLNIKGDYTDDWYLYSGNENILLKYMDMVAEEIEEKVPQVGDILIFRYGRQAGHTAIYIGAGKVIHAMNGFNVKKTGLGDDFFFDKKGRSRLIKIMRISHDKLAEVNK